MTPASAAERPCPICDCGEFWPVSFIDPATDRVVLRTNGYHWRLCRTCGSASPSVRICREDLQKYWDKNRVEESSFRVTREVWDRRLAECKVWGKRTFDFVAQWTRPDGRRFLDIGCGLGGTVARFQENGWDAYGLDPDPNTKAFHEEQGLRTRIGRFEDEPAGEAFDVICIAHAIYFVEEPRAFVRQVRKTLSDQGLFVIVSTHLLSSMTAGRPGFAHTWYPTRESLFYLLEQEGFEILATRSTKGSDMILARASGAKKPKGYPVKAWLAHTTQTLRHRTLGRLLLLGLNLVRGLRKVGKRTTDGHR